MTAKAPVRFLVSFFLNPTDEKVAPYVPLPMLPQVGLRIVLPDGGHPVYEVTHVQLHLWSAGAWEEDTGIMYADALVVPSRGIHPDTGELR